jgi:CubicO group peptidase (beta-lactamase class C family)
MAVSYPDGQPAAVTAGGRVVAYELRPAKSLAEVGITDPSGLIKADELVQKAIYAGAFPGCRVLAAKDGKIFYDRAFGTMTYDEDTYEPAKPVKMNTVYDLASITKIVSTTLAMMRLYEQGKISLDKPLGDYLPITQGTDKAALPLQALLLHQAGLKAWIPFYRSFYDSTGNLLDAAYRRRPDAQYSIEVAENLYLRNDYRDTVWQMILNSPLENAGRYVYSDLDYYFLAAVVEQVTGKPINRYVEEQFYTPMGLKMIGYLPLQFIKRDLIAPTENDLTFRGQVLQGYVHDPGAALFGGVAGHAGVFATAGDVAAIFQMLLNEGKYRGKTFFRPETIRRFTAYSSYISRRGLGFDKPAPEKYDGGPTDVRCSGYTFGHQGFTGTCAWADPQNGVVFIFLSNRVYPVADNGLINRLSTRTTVQGALYEALGIPEDTKRDEVKALQMPPLPK